MAFGSIIGALMALVPAIRSRALQKTDEMATDREQKLIREVEQLNRSRANLIDHIEALEQGLEHERHIASYWRREAERLLHGAHRCQHQADLNRALAQQQAQAQPNPFAGHLQQYAQAQMQSAQNQQAGCQLRLGDCGMHHAEMIARLNAQRS